MTGISLVTLNISVFVFSDSADRAD